MNIPSQADVKKALYTEDDGANVEVIQKVLELIYLFSIRYQSVGFDPRYKGTRGVAEKAVDFLKNHGWNIEIIDNSIEFFS